MQAEDIIIFSIALLSGVFFGYIISHFINAARKAALEAQLAQQQSQLKELDSRCQATDEALDRATTENNRLITNLAVLQQQLQGLTQERQLLAQQLSEIKQTSDALQKQLGQSQTEAAEQRTALQAETEKSREGLENVHRLQKQLVEQQDKTELAKQQRNEAQEMVATLKTASQKEQNRATEKAQEFSELKKELEQVRQQKAEVENVRNSLAEELATLNASLHEKEQSFARQLAQLDEQKAILKKEFQNMANEILEAKGKAFTEQNKVSLDAVLNPFKEQLEGFRKRVDEVHTHQTEGNATLKTELSKLHELNQRITNEAANLTRALKGDKKKQGNWGELQVEMILDQSGLRKGSEYVREANRKDDDSKNWRPDFIVNLPEGKHVVIDSKVSLNDYNDYVATDNDEQREVSLNKHVQAVRKHIDDLYKRDYSQLQGINSPDFVFMFMPIEPAFIAAFESDQKLFNNAFEKHIVVVTPTTLLATLRTIANLWSIERQNQNARVLADQGAKVYDKLRILVEKMDKLGTQLSTARTTYDDAFNTLTGSRSLCATVQKFTDLGVRVKKELPASIVETAQLSDDSDTSDDASVSIEKTS